MKQTGLFHTLLPFIIMSIPWIYLIIIWNDLPPTIATHFGIQGMPDAYGPKRQILISPAILSVIGIGVYFLLNNIHKIDPKRKYAETTSGVLSKIAVMVVVLLSAVVLFILNWTLHGKVENFSIFFCGMGLFVAYTGNLMHSIKPNYFAGFRLPWTLENEDNWRRTHQLASKIWFIGGIALAILSLLLSAKIVIIVFIAGVLIMAIIPGIYSYRIYKQSLK